MRKLVDDCGLVVGSIRNTYSLSKAAYARYSEIINSTNSINCLWEFAQELGLDNKTLANVSSMCFSLKQRMNKQKFEQLKILLLKNLNRKGCID